MILYHTLLCLMGAESLKHDSSADWRLRRFLWYEAEGGSTPLIRAEENELATLIKKGRWSCCPELHRAWGEAIIMWDLGWPPATAEGWDVCARVRMCFRITRDIPAWKERLWQHISLCFEHQLSGIFLELAGNLETVLYNYIEKSTA